MGTPFGNTSLRTLMFSDKIDTPNLGDFLRIKENTNSNISAGLTLGAVLSNRRGGSSPVHSNRTLLDIIRDDPSSSNRQTRKQTWTHFRNKLRLKRAGDAWTSNLCIQQDTNPIRLPPNSRNADSEVEIFGQPEISASGSRREIENLEEEENGGDEPVRMSLMALLAENDGDGSAAAYMIGDGDEEEDEDEDDDDDDGVANAGDGAASSVGGGYNSCCVCMVRHKGAAFIPCGHTFCRLCSRELWVQRGNCPLCNNFILEVLDIF